MKIKLALFVLLQMHVLCESNIVDFSYSEYVPSKIIQTKSKMSFYADSSSLQGYEFPSVCSGTRKLQQFRNVEISNKLGQHSTAYVDDLKSSFIELLKLGEKLKTKRQNIIQLGTLNSRAKNLTVPESDLSRLKAQESTLQQIDDEIKAKTQLLEELVSQSIQSTENNEFSRSWLDFQIQFLGHRRQQLMKALSNAQSATKVDKNDYDSYFVGLKDKFQTQSAMFLDLNSLLTDSHLLIELKTQLATLKSKILIGQILYKDKLECQQEIQKIKQTQKASMEQKISHLRQLKNEESTNDIIYCEGITRKLETQLKNILRAYDYTFECVEGINALEQELIDNRQKLRDIQKRIKQIEGEQSINNVLQKLGQNNENLKLKARDISRFTIPSYQNDPAILQSLIEQVDRDVEQAKSEKLLLESTGRRSYSQPPLDYQRIQELILSIKKLKARYCEDYDTYQRNSHEIWSRIYQFEADLQYEKKIESMYKELVRDLKALELDFEQARNRLVLKMK